jgi:enoyl-CoA hydratase
MNHVSYEFDGDIATIRLDDGKVNVMSLGMQTAILEAMERAEADHAPVVVTGRDGVFSAGFDLQTLRAGGDDALAMVQGGFELSARVLSFPLPIVMACTGHAVAMGAFFLLSGDYRLGAAGSYKLTANEVAIGLTMPRAAIEILRQRLTPAAFNRAVTLAESFRPDNAVETGFLDRVVEPSDLHRSARDLAHTAAGLDLDAHADSKLRARQATLEAIRSAIDIDRASYLALA